jgi:quercetin dioxygenase-like cupin family protein
MELEAQMMIPALRLSQYLIVLVVAFLSGATWAADVAIVLNQPDVKWAACGKDPPWNVCQRFVVRGDPAKEASDNMLRFPKGFALPKHWHDNAEQVVVTAGSMVISFEGGREETVRAGGFMYIPPKLAHWGTCPDGCTFFLGIVGPDSFYE